MKRPEYREAGKVGSCENCSAWKDARARAGGFGGRVCSCCCLRRSAPHLRWRKHGNSCSTRSWNGGHSRWSRDGDSWQPSTSVGGQFSANRLTTTRAPQPPRRMATVAHGATILHTATLRFSSPHPTTGTQSPRFHATRATKLREAPPSPRAARGGRPLATQVDRKPSYTSPPSRARMQLVAGFWFTPGERLIWPIIPTQYVE